MSFTYCVYVNTIAQKCVGQKTTYSNPFSQPTILSGWDFKLRSSGLAARTLICHFSLALFCSFMRQGAYNPFEKPLTVPPLLHLSPYLLTILIKILIWLSNFWARVKCDDETERGYKGKYIYQHYLHPYLYLWT